MKPLHSLPGLVLLAAALATLACAGTAKQAETSSAVATAMVGSHRSAENIARNPARHPVATLAFFGLEEDMTVLEANPGGLWYTEILAPVLRDEGRYIAATYDVSLPGAVEYQTLSYENMRKRFANEADVFGTPTIAKLSPPDSIDLGPDGSADMVLTFRNTHGWLRDGSAEAVYGAFFDVLKPGGVLGVVQHRAGPKTPEGFSGYVSQDQLIEIATAAGFVLEARSEINANPRDTADHPGGVWSLPPSFRLGDQDREKYAAIGESDRMTLRFRKP